jgi:hypothetical protein
VNVLPLRFCCTRHHEARMEKCRDWQMPTANAGFGVTPGFRAAARDRRRSGPATLSLHLGVITGSLSRTKQVSFTTHRFESGYLAVE